ncbi:MAG: pyridoxamine 5'-phosphate oxidase family protein [Sulfurovum sp.]|nr:pyridoxamine 5'-phosphate oxidase family protein [Sulfurovum sp.]
MGKQYAKLKPKDIEFIQAQKVFFLASCSGKEVNLSPKGYDSLRVLDESTLLYLDYPGSGNRTYRDAMAGGEFTVMFNAYEGKANITKLFCKAEVIGKDDKHFDTYIVHFDVNSDEVRQLFVFSIYAVETSCGDGVPFMEYKGERPSLKEWATKMSKNGKLEQYMKDHEVPPVLENLK